jgi:hypothetical protein
MIAEEPIEAPIEVKLDTKPMPPKKPNFGSKPSFGIKKPTFGLGAKKPSLQIAAPKDDPVFVVKKESPKPIVHKSIDESIEMEIDLDENIPTIEDS